MKYKIEIRPEAVKDLEQLDSTVTRRILKKLNWLKENFDLIVPEPLSGEFKGLYKLRVGNYRVVYVYDKQAKLISVHLVGHRKNIYK